MPSTDDFNEGLWKEGLGQIAALYGMMQKVGVTRALLERMRSEPDYLKRLAENAKQGAIQETLSQHYASVYFSHTFFSPADWWRYVGAQLLPEHLRLVEYFPWPAKLADQRDPFDSTKFIRDTFFAFPMWATLGPRDHEELVNLRWWWDRARDLMSPGATEKRPWFLETNFAEEPPFFPRWYLVRLEPPADSLNLTFTEQRERIPAGYEMVPPIVMATAQLLFALGHNYHFYEKGGFGRCGDSTGVLDGDGVIVGATREGLLIQERNDSSCDAILGLHLMRRMPVAGGQE